MPVRATEYFVNFHKIHMDKRAEHTELSQSSVKAQSFSRCPYPHKAAVRAVKDHTTRTEESKSPKEPSDIKRFHIIWTNAFSSPTYLRHQNKFFPTYECLSQICVRSTIHWVWGCTFSGNQHETNMVCRNKAKILTLGFFKFFWLC